MKNNTAQQSSPACLADVQVSQADLFPVALPPPDPYRKAVAAIHAIPNEPMTLIQRKLSNALLKQATKYPRDADGFWTTTSIRLREEIDFDSNNTSHLKLACKQLVSMTFEFDVLSGDDRSPFYDVGNLFSRIQLFRNGQVRFKLSDDVADDLLKPSIYALIDMSVIRSFRSAVSCALYEFATRFEGIGHTARVDFPTLSGMLQGRRSSATSEDPRYFLYRRLRPAIEEVNAVSGLILTLHRTKAGPDGRMFQFTIQRKPRLETSTVESIDVLEAVGKLVSAGMHQRSATKLVRSYGAEACIRAVRDFEARLRDTSAPAIRNPKAFLVTLLSNLPPVSRTVRKPPAKAQGAAFDLQASYLEVRRQEAIIYIRELDQPSRLALVERYNAVCSPSLKVGQKLTRVTVIAFSKWVAQEVWGDPTPDQLLAHASQLLNLKPQAT